MSIHSTKQHPVSIQDTRQPWKPSIVTRRDGSPLIYGEPTPGTRRDKAGEREVLRKAAAEANNAADQKRVNEDSRRKLMSDIRATEIAIGKLEKELADRQRDNFDQAYAKKMQHVDLPRSRAHLAARRLALEKLGGPLLSIVTPPYTLRIVEEVK